jgi:hypothetical protein
MNKNEVEIKEVTDGKDVIRRDTKISNLGGVAGVGEI